MGPGPSSSSREQRDKNASRVWVFSRFVFSGEEAGESIGAVRSYVHTCRCRHDDSGGVWRLTPGPHRPFLPSVRTHSSKGTATIINKLMLLLLLVL